MAGVIRRETYATRPVFSFEDIEARARETMTRAQTQAAEIIGRAEQEARRRGAEIEREARQRGFEQGRREGAEHIRAESTETALREAREKMADLERALSEGLAAFEENRRRLLALAECGLINLALAIARRVCKRDVAESSEATLANCRTLLGLAEHEADVELHLNPEEYELLRDAVPGLLASAGRLEHVQIVADVTVERGGCAVHTRDGTIDASIETQLDRVAQSLTPIKATGQRNNVTT